MECPSKLICSMYADNALPGEDARRLEMHLQSCSDCASRVGQFRAERAVISDALRNAEVPCEIPRFAGRPSLSTLMEWMGWIALGGWLTNMAWSVVSSSTQLPQWAGWFAPETGSVLTGAAGFLLWTFDDGLQMIEALLRFAVLAAVIVSAAVGLIATLRRNAGSAASMMLIGVVGLSYVPAGFALDIRGDEEGSIYVSADETIDDTLVAYGEKVEIAGNVTGDLVAFGQSVTITGTVGGSVIAAAEEVSIEGNIGGTVIAAGDHVDYESATVGGNAIGAASRVQVDDSTRVSGNLVGAAERLEVEGSVERSLFGFARRMELYGIVNGDVRGSAAEIEIGEGARVGGRIEFTAPERDAISVDDGASVTGDVTVTPLPVEPNRYERPGFYIGETLSMLAAFLTGMALFYLFPSLSEVGVFTGREALYAGAIGVVTFAAMPTVAAIAMITVVGIPLGILTFMTWGLGLYLAGIVTSMMVGSIILDPEKNRTAVPLLAGLTLFFVLVNIPVIGGVVRAVAVIVGLGMIAQWIWAKWSREPELAE